MKKLVLAFTMVVLLAAAVFGGQAIASSKSNDVSVSEETSEILFDWGGSYWGSPLRMQTISGNIVLDDTQASEVVYQTYPDTRNVHLTVVLNDDSISGDGSFELYISVGGLMSPYGYIYEGDIGIYTYEFDTTEWELKVDPASIGYNSVLYEATITYPR